MADVLFGDQPFTGKLRYNWPRDMGQVDNPSNAVPLFGMGYGLN